MLFKGFKRPFLQGFVDLRSLNINNWEVLRINAKTGDNGLFNIELKNKRRPI